MIVSIDDLRHGAVLGAVGLLLLSPRARRVQEEHPDVIPSQPLAMPLPSEPPPAGAVSESPLSATGNSPS